MQLPVPVTTLLVLAVIAHFDVGLSAFLGHAIAAVGCFMILSVVTSAYAHGDDGYLRYMGFALPWVGLLELTATFVAAQGGALGALDDDVRRASFLIQAGSLAVAPLWTQRKVRIAPAVAPWGIVAALLFAALLGAAPGAAEEARRLHAADLGIGLLFTGAVLGLARQRLQFDRRIHALLIAGVASTFTAFLVFAADLGGVLGDAVMHAGRLLGLWLFYVAAERSRLDLTETRAQRERSQAALKESEARFRSLVELSSDWYWEQDAELRFTRLDGPIAEHFGGDPSPALGKRRWEIEGLTPLSGSWEAHRADCEARKAFRGLQYARRDRRGELTYLEVSGEPVFDADGRFRGYRGLASDVTPRRRAEAEREKVGRMYASLSALNELVARARSADELLKGVCDIAVASGDFQVAVTRLVDRDTQQAAIVGRSGEQVVLRYQRPLDVRPGSQDASTLTVAAYLGGRAIKVRDAEAAPLGVKSAGAFPLLQHGKPVGTLLLRSHNADAFEGEVGTLLERMAANVSLGLTNLEVGEALRRFRLALDHSGDMIVLIDSETMRLVDANGTFCKALGYRREEVLGMPPERFLPLGREELAAAYGAVIAEQSSSASFRSHFVCKDGSTLPFEATRRVLRSGARWLIVGIARDIRERLAAEEALQRRDAYFRSLMESVSDAIAVADMQWRYVYVSPSTLAVSGYAPEELIGRRFADTTSIGDADALRRRLEAMLERSAEPQLVRFELRRKDGEIRIHETMVSKGNGPDDQPVYVIAGRDITDRVRAEEALRKQEQELRTLAHNSPDGILRFDRDLRCTFVNAAVEKATGREAASVLGSTLLEQGSPPEIRVAWEAAMRSTFATGEGVSVDYSFDGALGLRDYQARFAPERSADGSVASVLVIVRDLTDRRRAERAVAESEARLRSIVQATAQPLLLVDPEGGTTVFANPAAGQLFGRSAAELEGAPLGLPIAEGRPADIAIVLPNGGIRPAEMQFARTELQGREVLVVSMHDLSERRRYEEHIEHLANHDALTGLPNRALVRDRIEQATARARRTERHVALLFVDLDHFKLVNDSFGHAAGDTLLLEVGARLKRATRDGDTVARLGGDEFVVIAPDLAQPGDSAVVAAKITAALAAPLTVNGTAFPVSASIGISLFPGDGDGLDSLLQCADVAMYRAKDAGRNNYQFYSAEMGVRARSRVETETGLRRALEREELRLHYQPQVDLVSGEVIGFEALMRWQHPERGMVSPASFIPVAEESGLIMPIGEWALRTACRDAMAWAAAGLGSLKVAVNLSARQFWHGSVTEAVRRALAETGLPPQQLEVEITESVVARDLKQVMNGLEQLRRMGVSVAIDDFGTGYSSLSYLRSLPIQKLKIDKSFIDAVPGDPEGSALVREIINLAHVLSLYVVAEGVEAHAQAAYLREAGCEAMQGYVFSRPLPAADCAVLLRARRRFAHQIGELDG